MRRRRAVIGTVAILLVATGFLVTVLNRKRAESRMCAGRLFPLTFSAMMWANEREEHYPTNLMYLSSEWRARRLICPSDTLRKPAQDWDSFDPDRNSSYEIVSPGIVQGDTNRAFLRCRIHGHLSYTDATVFDGERRRRKY
jgi:hypothetical protein